jgi:hypothetical protein
VLFYSDLVFRNTVPDEQYLFQLAFVRKVERGMESDAFQGFGEESFDVKQWVNAQVKSSEALALAAGNAKGTSVDDHLSTLVVKLQLLTQQSSKSIDEHSTVAPQLPTAWLSPRPDVCVRACPLSAAAHAQRS